MVRWDSMPTVADVTSKFIETVIEIIGRKTSEEYAAITIRTILQKLQHVYPFLSEIEVRNARSIEMDAKVKTHDTLNEIAPKQVGFALKELIRIIMNSLGKTAGYFFIRETREKIGIDYEKILLKTMDVDLTLMQSTYIVEKKSMNILEIHTSDVMRRFLHAFIDALEKQTSKTFAITFLSQKLIKLQQQYPFLTAVTIQNIRYTLGSEEIVIQPQLDTLDPKDVGKAICSILQDTDKELTELGRNSIASDLKSHLTMEYLLKLADMGVTITAYSVGYHSIFIQVIKTLIDVIAKTSNENYAVIAVNSFLRKIDTKYEFLKHVAVEPASDKEGMYHIVLSENIDSITETDARRAIQQLLGVALDNSGEKKNGEFIQQFKDELEKKYLLKLEEIGVNFHMIELHQAMAS